MKNIIKYFTALIRTALTGLCFLKITDHKIAKELVEENKQEPIVLEKKSEKQEQPKRSKKTKVNLSDPLHKKILVEILDLYGYPVSTDSCLNKQERVMHVFGLMAAFQALGADSELLENYEKDGDVETICRKFYERHGHHIIPNEDEMQTAGAFNLLKLGTADKLDTDSQKKEE